METASQISGTHRFFSYKMMGCQHSELLSDESVLSNQRQVSALSLVGLKKAFTLSLSTYPHSIMRNQHRLIPRDCHSLHSSFQTCFHGVRFERRIFSTQSTVNKVFGIDFVSCSFEYEATWL